MKIKESELNELVHLVGDFLDKYSKTPVDRFNINDRISEILEWEDIDLIEDPKQ